MITRFWQNMLNITLRRAKRVVLGLVLSVGFVYGSLSLYSVHSNFVKYREDIEKTTKLIERLSRKDDIISKRIALFLQKDLERRINSSDYKNQDDHFGISRELAVIFQMEDIFGSALGPKVSYYSYIFPAFVLLITVVPAIFLITYKRKGANLRLPSGYNLHKWLLTDAAEERIGALQLQHQKWVGLYGLKRANKIYRWQLIGTITSYYLDAFLQKTRLIDLIEKYLTPPSK